LFFEKFFWGNCYPSHYQEAPKAANAYAAEKGVKEKQI
jgi:hypothetical protein